MEDPKTIDLESVSIIQTWPQVSGDFGGEMKPTCSHCNSQDIRRDPADSYGWGCGHCGLNSLSISIYFPLK